ncbi:MAG: hypothetical protein J5715_01825 [Clostridiales bacterium]|nr:hypothetical protein [Clostridiales bacterium]
MRKISVILLAAIFLISGIAACSQNPLPEDTSSITDESSSVSITEVTNETGTKASEEPATTDSSEASSVTTTEDLPDPSGYRFNAHVLPELIVRMYGKGFEADYYRFCDAALAGEDSVALENKENYSHCLDVARTCLPVAYAFLQYTDPAEAAVGDGTYKLFYTIPKEDYLIKVGKFKERVKEIIGSVYSEDASPLELALAFYSEESERIDYDHDLIDENDNLVEGNIRATSVYYVLMNNKGICQEIAGCYAYLLLQVGIDATTCTAVDTDIRYGHEWTVVKIGNNYYHCDVTKQTSHKGSISYFGMTDEQRNKIDDWDIDTFNFGGLNVFYHDDLPINDKTFEPLWKSSSYKIDRDKHMLYCYNKKSGKKAYFKMSLE